MHTRISPITKHINDILSIILYSLSLLIIFFYFLFILITAFLAKSIGMIKNARPIVTPHCAAVNAVHPIISPPNCAKINVKAKIATAILIKSLFLPIPLNRLNPSPSSQAMQISLLHKLLRYFQIYSV